MLIFSAPGRWKNVVRLGFAPDGQSLFGGYSEYGIVKWDISSKSVANQFRMRIGTIVGLSIHPKGEFVCIPSGYEGLIELECNTLTPINRFTADIQHVGWRAVMAPDGNRLVHAHHEVVATGGARTGIAGRVLTEDAGKLEWLQFDSSHTSATYCYLPHNGKLVTTDRPFSPLNKERLAIRHFDTGEVEFEIACPSKIMDELAASPDGNAVVLLAGRSLFAWDVRDFTKPPLKVSNDNRLSFTNIAFHPSGRFLAATSNDTTVKLYDTASWRLATTFTWDVGKLRSVAFSPDGSLGAVGSDTGKVVVWDVDV